MMDNLHQALRTKVIKEVNGKEIHYKYVLLQNGKNDLTYTLHAQPVNWTNGPPGSRTTDFLHFLGFKTSQCVFHNGECYAKKVDASLDVDSFANSFNTAFRYISDGFSDLMRCGIHIRLNEEIAFFYGSPSYEQPFSSQPLAFDVHTAAKPTHPRKLEDDYFHFVLTFIKGAKYSGWTTHYRPKNMPTSPEFDAVLNFIGGFKTFEKCPEFNFESCWWRFNPIKFDANGIFLMNNQDSYNSFDAHVPYFSSGLKKLLTAHVELQKHDMSFLSVSEHRDRPISTKLPGETVPTEKLQSSSKYKYDIAISFAGTERKYAEKLAKIISEADFEVFYDNYYPEQLWGKDLTSLFDSIYRKESRYCVMFVSSQYKERMWTTHERRSAQARALEEKMGEYILPIRVDDTDLEGLPPTVGYMDLNKTTIEEIASTLIRKLKTS
jgi:hypothetical protein